MTDFLAWWADHWPLAVVLVPLLIFYPVLALYIAEWWVRVFDWPAKRRREP